MIAFDGALAIAIILEAQNGDPQQFRNCRARLIIAPAAQSRYLIFKILEMGLNRVLGQVYSQTQMQIDGWTRIHEHYSGRPRWQQGDHIREVHPNGWTRQFSRNNGLHRWEKAGSEPRWESSPQALRNGLKSLF